MQTERERERERERKRLFVQSLRTANNVFVFIHLLLPLFGIIDRHKNLKHRRAEMMLLCLQVPTKPQLAQWWGGAQRLEDDIISNG